MRVYTHVDAVLGPKRSFTPEGYLYCEDVPLARTGVQLYLPSELDGIPPGPDGLIHVSRDPADVFTDKAMRSFVGKPATDDHPPQGVSAVTWRDHSVGTLLNPRKGDGDLADTMVGDLLICHPDAIKNIMDGKREVSCGYSAEYEVTGPGKARQYDIIGNHVAIVKQGRCGSRCAIGDHDMTPTTTTSVAAKIGKVTYKNSLDAIRKMLDEAEAGAAAEDAGGTSHHVHINVGGTNAPGVTASETDVEKVARLEREKAAMTDDSSPMGKLAKLMADGFKVIGDRLAKLETKDGDDDDEKNETPAEKEAREKKDMADKAKMTGDAKPFVLDAAAIPAALQDFTSRAELIVPGVRMPTLDAKGDPKVVTDSLCQQRRSVLTTAMMLPNSNAVMLPLLAGQQSLDRMTCDAINTVFVAASETIKARNNGGAAVQLPGGALPAGARKVGDAVFTGPVTPAEINARNAHFNTTVRKGG